MKIKPPQRSLTKLECGVEEEGNSIIPPERKEKRERVKERDGTWKNTHRKTEERK